MEPPPISPAAALVASPLAPWSTALTAATQTCALNVRVKRKEMQSTGS